MSTVRTAKHHHDFDLVQSGPTHLLGKKFSRVYPPAARRLVRTALLVLLAWLPIVVLAYISSHLVGLQIGVSLLRDPEVHCRFLLALPILSLAEALISVSLATQVRHLVESGIIPPGEHDNFIRAQGEVIQLRQNVKIEAFFSVLALAFSLVINLYFAEGTESTWQRQGATMTPAGWWYTVVSLPILFFFLLRAAGIFLLWGWFLFRVSRMDLQLTSTHPDHAGGLGFLAWGLACFSPVLFSFSTVLSAAFAYQIFHRGESLDSLKYHLIVYVLAALLVVHLPLVSYCMRLSRCRFAGLLEFSALAWRYDREFDEKWINESPGEDQNTEPLLGSADIQSLADIATAYEHAEEMRLMPLDSKSLMVLAAAALLPMVPLIGTELPLPEIVSKLGEFLV